MLFKETSGEASVFFRGCFTPNFSLNSQPAASMILQLLSRKKYDLTKWFLFFNQNLLQVNPHY